MRILLTGATGYVGGRLAPRLLRDGHELVAVSRAPESADGTLPGAVDLIRGDVITGRGLKAALRGVEVAYYLVHSMEPSPDGPFAERERRGAETFARLARQAGVQRIVYLGGPLAEGGPRSAHLASRLAVEETLRRAVPDSVALRASIVIGGRSRPFRFLVRLIERLPLIALPAWHTYRSAPIDERDIVELLARAAASEAVSGMSLDAPGREVVSYGTLIVRIRDHMLIDRPRLNLNRITLTPIASRVAAAVAGESFELIGPLMESLSSDLLPADDRAAELLNVRRHTLDAAIEHALRELESLEPVAAR